MDRLPNWMIEGEVDTVRNLLIKEHVYWKLVWTPWEGNSLAHNLAKLKVSIRTDGTGIANVGFF